MSKVKKNGSDEKSRGPLDTPTDLSANAVPEISDALNGVVADAFALYVKVKNFHWHMSGPHFRDYHEMLDDHGDAIFATIDPLAERVRKIGGTTVRSIGHIAKLQSLEDNDKEFVGPRDMLIELMQDNKAVAKRMREAHSVADKHEDVASASLLEQYIDETERRTWFLFEASRNAEESGH